MIRHARSSAFGSPVKWSMVEKPIFSATHPQYAGYHTRTTGPWIGVLSDITPVSLDRPLAINREFPVPLRAISDYFQVGGNSVATGMTMRYLMHGCRGYQGKFGGDDAESL